ncbi:MAG TPA: hypothetical protein DCX06_12400 [Opitutae bacterium]|nr:hypothetical protein [Opitutae bacterium]
MEDAQPVQLVALERDWIVGISGSDFYEKACAYAETIKMLSAADRLRGVLLAECDPIEFSAAFFAAMSLGVPVILANPKWGARERAELARLVSPKLCFGLELDNGVSKNTRLPMGRVLIPTGGSTGGVKLATHTWESLAAACRGVQEFLGGGVIDSCCVLPLYHVSGLMQLLRSFITSGRIRFDEDAVASYCLSYVPTQLQRALANSGQCEMLNAARAIFVGGGPLSEAVADEARKRGLPIVPVYGMTETAAMVAAISAEDFRVNPKIGAKPVGLSSFSIESDGAIRIQSPALFEGYHGRPSPDLTHGYLTSDQGYLDAEGRLHVTGRMDRLIITGGEKVDPLEVEAVLREFLGLDELLVYGVSDPDWGQRVVVFYTSEEAKELQSDWYERVRPHLANYKIPKQWLRVDSLPLDPRGKVDHGLIHQLLG